MLITDKGADKDSLDSQFSLQEKESIKWDKLNKAKIEQAKKDNNSTRYYDLIDTQGVYLNRMLETDRKSRVLSGEILTMLKKTRMLENKIFELEKSIDKK